MDQASPDYGLDAPSVVRNLCLAGALALILWGLCQAGILPGSITIGPVNLIYADGFFFMGTGMLLTGLYMLWSSKVGKIRDREAMLDLHQWTGAEHVLDVGCGRGLLLVGAAKRVTTGHVTGIDIWQAEDLSGNTPDAPVANARIEGVVDRVSVKTADMRTLPFPDASFDLIISRYAIHNIYDAEERGKAIREIARVMRPGAEALIEDLGHEAQYARIFRESGCEMKRLSSAIVSMAWGLITFGSYRPGVFRVTRST